MKLALFGYGGHALEVSKQIGKPLTFFVDDEYVCGDAISIKKFNPKEYKLLIAVSDSNLRENIISRLPSETKYFSFIHPSSYLLDENIVIGEGSFIGINCILTTNIIIGKHCILNRGNHIGHHSNIGNFFSMMPGSIVSGNVNIGNNVYMGTNSTVIENKTITNNVIIGANAVVIKDINESGTYIGVPAKKK